MTILQILFGVNSIIYKGVIAPQSEVTIFPDPAPLLLRATQT